MTSILFSHNTEHIKLLFYIIKFTLSILHLYSLYQFSVRASENELDPIYWYGLKD